MSNAAFHVRRATIDDLASLLALWNSMQIPTAGLERRITEFQVVESEEGALLGALGMQVIGRHARLHSEAFVEFTFADHFRAHLWERMQSLAANHGLVRLWTTEAAPFWKRNGFNPPDAGEMNRLPSGWASVEGNWVTLELRDEDALLASLEMDFERLRAQEREQTENALRKARTLKYIAVALGAIVAVAALGFCFNLLRHLPLFQRR